MEESLDQDYSNIVGSSAAVSATLQGNRIINLKRNVRDINNNTSKTFSCPYIFSDSAIKPLLAPVEVSKRVVDCTSASGLLNIKINDMSSSSTTKDVKCVIEVTRDISLEKIIDVTNVHGKVIGDAWFGKSGCNNFSVDEKYFVYVAVPKPSKATSYFDTQPPPVQKSTEIDQCSVDKGESSMFPSKYDYKEDWGEKYTGVSELGLYVLNIETGKVARIPGVPAGVTAGQPIFTPCGRGVVYTAWRNEPKRLGMIYCFQRPCSLQLVSIVKLLDSLDCPTEFSDENSNESNDEVDVQMDTPLKTALSANTSASVSSTMSTSKSAESAPHICLTAPLRLARYPQFSPGGDDVEDTYLVFLGHEKGFDTHNASSGLYALNWAKLLLTTGPALWDAKRGQATEVDVDKFLDAVIEPASPTMAKSNVVLINNFHFPGLFASSIAPCSFISPKLLLLETNWRAVSVILVANIETCELRVISMQEGSFHLSNVFYSSYTVKKQISHLGEQNSESVDYATPVGLPKSRSAESSWQHSTPFSLNLLCVAGGGEGGIVVLASNTSSRPRLGFITAEELLPLLAPSKMSGLMSMIPFSGHGKKLLSTFSDVFPLMALAASSPKGSSSCMDGIAMTENALDDLQSYVVQARASDNHSVLIESMLLFPSSDFPGEGIPLLVVPHGGPHSQFTTSYLSPYAYMALTLDMAVLMVNYRGSTGYGQAELDSLPGRIGARDVADMHTATLAALELNDVRLDSQRICVAGGSHGGFLTGHLLGQFPSLFRAGALRNPVINVPSMAMVSDITDWCIVEACGVRGSEKEGDNPEMVYNFDTYDSPNMSQLTQMYHCSPIRHVQNVTAPVLLLLGAKDRRVPVSQGLEYYHNLRRVPDRLSANVPTEMRLYPDADHAIDIPDSEADQFISMKKWFAKYV